MTDESQYPGKSTGNDDADTREDTLTAALETTLEGLNRSIAMMEEIVRKIESGEPDWEENIKLLAEANELAEASSRQLDQVVQDVVYGESGDETSGSSVSESSGATEVETGE